MFRFISIRFVELRRQAECRRQITKILLSESGDGCLLRLFPTWKCRLQPAPAFRGQGNQPLTRIIPALDSDEAIPLQDPEISSEGRSIQSKVLGQSRRRHRLGESNANEDSKLGRLKT